MKQLIEMFFFDVKMNFKSFMGAYMIIVPMVILIVIRTFLPSVQSATSTFAIVTKGPNAVVNQELIESLDDFADIETYDSIKDMEQKLRGTGTAEGLYWDPATQQYVSVMERSLKGDTIFSVASRYIRQLYYQKNYPDASRITEFLHGVPAELSDRTKTPPVATMGGSIFIVFMIIVTAFIIGLGVVMDKEYGTDKALQVSPLSKSDYFIGKSIFPLFVMALYTILALLMLGLMHINILQVYLVVLSSFTISLLFGLLIGALGKNENEAIGIGKLLSMVLMLAILGGTLLPENLQWLVWWAPIYWIYDILEEIFTETATWGSIAWKSAVMVGLTGLYFILLRKKIIKGLS